MKNKKKKKKSQSYFHVGQRIRLTLGSRRLTAEVIEDMGLLAPNKQRLYRLEIKKANPNFFTNFTEEDIKTMQKEKPAKLFGR